MKIIQDKKEYDIRRLVGKMVKLRYDIEKKGDISICFKCAAILEFDKDLKLKVCSEDKINKLDTETLVQIVKIRSYILGNK